MPEKVRYTRGGGKQPVRYTEPKQSTAQQTVNRQGYYIDPSVKRTGYNNAYDVNLWRTNFPAGMPKNLPGAAYLQPSQYGWAQGASMTNPAQQAPTYAGLPQQAYMTPEQWGGMPGLTNRAPNTGYNAAQTEARRVAQMQKGPGYSGGPIPVFVPQQAYMTEQQWGGPETIPWNYPPATPTTSGGGDWGYGGGGGGYSPSPITIPTPDIPKWLAGLVSWTT